VVHARQADPGLAHVRAAAPQLVLQVPGVPGSSVFLRVFRV
jgi:hypothetical protein